MIADIRLQNFRSYHDDSFEFSPATNIIVGPNASGKTNLLEALLMICQGQSYRSRDANLIMFSKPWARLDGHVPGASRSLKLVRQEGELCTKTLSINNKIVKRLTQAKSLPAVLFEPHHLLLFHEGPEARRDYLDDLLEQLYPTYTTLRRRYKRTLSQRNRLLKTRPRGLQTQLFAWDVRLSELGGQIAGYRSLLLETINAKLADLYRTLSSSTVKTTAEYHSKLDRSQYSSQLLHKLQASLAHDLERSFTSYGPHRDDLIIKLDGHSVEHSASRGEVRSLLLALKVIELELFEGTYNSKPVLLLDDVFSELDGARRQSLKNGYQ
ncbi:DNA replication/repair protein RecF [Candidatus Saccharibacteria bacterium]|nr:DNA replication/repair protein RecF [Candidatus Saccharibacteria bacterium]